MGKLRVARLEEAFKQEISDIIQHEMKDPRIGFVSVTRVALSGDLHHVTAYVSILGDEEAKKSTLVGLARATGFLRSELSRRIRLRYTPELTFKLDESIAYSIELTSFIDRLREGAEYDDIPSSRDKNRSSENN
ncbi:MAG: 30S ribosome-binding factor RbfA [Firmicutes bacterium]|jgi:ribosome-binding factor A|nr:30S ribosome-binding factor RbfA [Bacillota bacterium]